MAAHGTLKETLELEELKKDTAVTRSIKASTQRLLALDQAEEVHVEGLVTKLREAYHGMLQSEQHCPSCSNQPVGVTYVIVFL